MKLGGFDSGLVEKYGLEYLERNARPRGNPALFCIFDKGNGDQTSPLPFANFDDYAKKGWSAVRLLVNDGKDGNGRLIDAPAPTPEPVEA